MTMHPVSEQTESVLEEAQRIIHGQRNQDYGSPRQNMRHTADLWSAYLSEGGGDRIEITANDVAMMMVLLKVARASNADRYKRDNFVDIAGYAGVADRVVTDPVVDS